MLAGTIDRVASSLKKSVSFYAAHGISPFMTVPVQKSKPTRSFNLEERYVYDLNRLRHLDEWKPKVVVISSKWSNEYSANEDLIKLLSERGTKVILIQQPPELYFGDVNALQYISFLRLLPKHGLKQTVRAKMDDSDYRSGQRYVRELCVKYKSCYAIEVEDAFRDPTSGDVYVLDGKDVLYTDEDHLSQRGAEILQSRIQAVIESVFKGDYRYFPE